MNEGQAKVRAEALRQLADELSSLAGRILDHGQRLDSGLNRLGQTFQDAHYHEFRALFRTTRLKLDQFADDVRRLTPSLRSDADLLDRYESIRPE